MLNRPKPDQETDDCNRYWVQGLRAGSTREQTSERLYHFLLRVAQAETRRRGTYGPITGPELDDIAHHAAADALLTITARLDQFRGDARFTTWAYKFVIFDVAAKLRRHFWWHADLPFDADGYQVPQSQPSLDPTRAVEGYELADALRRAIDTVLTPRQRHVVVARAVLGTSIAELASELGVTRNALYKMHHDARRKLRHALGVDGHPIEQAARRSA